MMSPFHTFLALLVAVIWGVAFVVSKNGLEYFTPAQLTALRFMVAAILVLWLPRPNVSWWSILGIGLTIFTGQFLLQFFGLSYGMPAGLTAVVAQTQAIFTVMFAAIFLRDMPSLRQVVGMLIAFAGILLIGVTVTHNVVGIGFMFTLASAISWAAGNVLIKKMQKVDMLHLIVWCSLIPPIPALAVSYLIDGPLSIWHSISTLSLQSLAAPIYLGLLASVIAYAIWGFLLQKYSAAVVAPFALLAPLVGAIVSAIVFSERFTATRLIGIASLLAGLAVISLPRGIFLRLRSRLRI